MLTIAPPSPCSRIRRAAACQQEHSLDVHRLDAAELLERQAVDQQVGEDAGIVDEDVEPAERLHGGLHEALGVFGVVDGSDRRGNRPALGRKPLRRRLEPVGPYIREQDGGAGVCQAVAQANPNPCAAPVTRALRPSRRTSSEIERRSSIGRRYSL